MRFPSVVVLACAAACSPANPTPEVVKPVALDLDAGPTGPNFATPAKWVLAFSARWRSIATLDLDGGSKLHAGEGGERWVETTSGDNEGAHTLAPERIVGIQRADSVYRFVGASGTVYVAHDALGVLSRTGNPVEGTRQVAVGKSAILVVDGKGDLQRSIDGGRAWTRVDLPQKEGIVVDIAMLGDKGILVAAPQRFYGTKDDGVTWTVVKSPGIGVQTVVAREGSLWVDGVEDSMRFDAAWGTFQTGASTHATARRTPPSKIQPQTINRIDGRRAVQITGNATERVWSFATGDPSGLGKARKVDELDGCEMVEVALRGDDVAIACDARGTVASGIDHDAAAPVMKYGYGRTSGPPDGGSLGWITRILRSTDGGRSFHEETTVEGGIPQRSDAAIALGPEDFIYLGRRCGQGYNAPCLPARVRAVKSAGFSELPGEDDTNANSGHMRFATNTMQSAAYSIGMRDNEAFLFRWKSGSAIPEPIGRIAQAVDQAGATLSLDDDGTVRGFARSGQNAFTFSYKEGGTVTTTAVQVPIVRAAFAGVHGFAVTNVVSAADAKAYETVDGGKTWGLVGSPAYVTTIDACSAFGCVTDRGVRWGWDAPAGTPDGVQNAAAGKPQYARPLRCSAKDKWVDIGGGNLPNVSDVDHGGVRWLLPTRDKDGKVSLVMSKRGEATMKTTSLALLGAPLGAPKFGTGTTMHVQPDGIVALRYTYSRERKLGRYNPVDAQLAWYRDASGKVFRASANKNPAFRVNKDPQGGYDRDQQPAYSELPEIVALSPKGVYFHPATYFEEDDTGNGDPKRVPLMLLRDDGKTEKVALPEGSDNNGGTGMMATLDGTTTLLARSPESWTSTSLTDGKKTFFSVLGGLGDDDGAVDLITLGGKAAFAATLREPARAWTILLKGDPELGTVTPIATQKSLGDTPKACDGAPALDPSAYRVDAPYVFGSRRPVVVDSDGVAIVLATDRAEIRGTLGQPDACVAAFDAIVPSQDGDHDYGALIFADDLAHSVLFRADTSGNWPAPIAMRAMECQYQAGPLPEELESVEGFVPDTRHSAVPRKRY